ncbi:MAG: hypothetical protein IKZ64_02620 [Alphaproteobacteria bacterium]|nr:hypothetical protein [Alphaproteobacteria bacterium]
MAREKRAREISTAEMTRLIYQVNKRLYRLEKSGGNQFNTTYENALAIIQRGEKKSDKKRLTISKNPERLHEQYLRALEISGGGNYEELTTAHIKSEIKRQREREQKLREENAEIKRRSKFQQKGIDNVDYAVYNLIKSREFRMLSGAESLTSDIILRTLAPAINAGLGTSQLKQLIRRFLKESEGDDQYYMDNLETIVNEYAERYT